MSQEEFDNRLKSSFQDEYLPPNDRMWVNITQKLDAKAKIPVWNWLLPILIAVICVGIWIGIDRKEANQNTIAAQADEGKASNDITSEKGNTNPLSSQTSTSNVENTEPTVSVKRESIKSAIEPSTHSKGHKEISASHTGSRRVERPNRFNPLRTNLLDFNPRIVTENPLIANEELLNWLKRSGFTPFNTQMEFEDLNPVAQSNTKDDPTEQEDNSNADFKVGDFTSKRWLNFGLGPQLAINTINIDSDSQAYVHKHLWDNRDRMTSNGTGFQAFAHFGYKFGKNQRFMFETGLNYSLRTEDIKLNESSYDIPARDNNGKIVNYAQIILNVITYNTVTGQWDTTKYLAVSNFSLAVNNKYHVFTLPFKLSYEYKLSEATFISGGLGGGISMLHSRKSEHLDMVSGNSKKQGKSTQFSANASATIGLYTNFNNVGQIGIYTSYQMYMNPWKVNSNQYSINMSDAQFGIMFRRPF